MWNLDQLRYCDIRGEHYEIAVLPLGATEPHNLHLPYGTDTFQSRGVAERVCESAWNRGAKIMLLPAIPYGTETNQREFPFAMNLNPSTLYAVIADLVDSLLHRGIRKIVLFNGHGGNELKGFLREMYGKSNAKLFACNWFQVFRDVYGEIFEESDDHAGEMETSLALSLFPELVARDENGKLLADEGKSRETRFEAINRGWVSITRPWEHLTTNSGAGNPHKASAEKGEKAIRIIVERIADFLVELSRTPIDERFPFKELKS